MKTKEELNALKEEVEALNAKLGQLTDKELEQVTGGVSGDGKLGFSGGNYVIKDDEIYHTWEVLPTIENNTGENR